MNYFDEARRYLQSSNCLKRKYACVIVNEQGHMISVGFNGSKKTCNICAREKTEHNTGTYEECPAIHAEQSALLRAFPHNGPPWDLQGHKLYLVCSDELDPEPCPTCQKMLTWAGVTLRRELDK